MCYDVSSGLMAALKYAKHRRDDPAEVAVLEQQLTLWQRQIKAHHVVSGFAHPSLLVFTNITPNTPQAYVWGLIPAWTKDKTNAHVLWNQTLNARSESMFEKASFKKAAMSQRCIIYIDAYYEYHHAKGQTFPYYISMKDKSPLALAGLWDTWIDKETGEVHHGVAIVTTKANAFLSKIHNNPKLEEARMPVVLPRDKQEEWLQEIDTEADIKKIQALCKALPDEAFSAHTVRKLKGKDALGDCQEATEAFVYKELTETTDLFS